MSLATTDELVGRALEGDRRAIAKLITLVEDGGDRAQRALTALYPSTGRAYTVGITGAPGAGKSTLTDRLVGQIRRGGDSVAVLAIDPSSPFSGGAILGDRVRMQEHATDPGVYIRSMATRGHLGGLALAAPQAIRVLDAAGYPYVLIETVGVGQVEVEVASATDTTIVVVNPGWGDSVQVAKAGLLEVADIFVVNKADRPGADEAARDLEHMLDLSGPGEWRPPVLTTVAATGQGVDALWATVLEHRAHLEDGGRLDAGRAARLREELRGLVAQRLDERAGRICRGERFDVLVAEVVARRMAPQEAAEELLGPLADG